MTKQLMKAKSQLQNLKSLLPTLQSIIEQHSNASILLARKQLLRRRLFTSNPIL